VLTACEEPEPGELAPLVRVLTVWEPEPAPDVEPEVGFEPLLRVVTTGAADAAGAAAPAPLERVRAIAGVAALEPPRAVPEGTPPGPVPLT
jgi:hypothetical protein